MWYHLKQFLYHQTICGSRLSLSYRAKNNAWRHQRPWLVGQCVHFHIFPKNCGSFKITCRNNSQLLGKSDGEKVDSLCCNLSRYPPLFWIKILPKSENILEGHFPCLNSWSSAITAVGPFHFAVMPLKVPILKSIKAVMPFYICELEVSVSFQVLTSIPVYFGLGAKANFCQPKAVCPRHFQFLSHLTKDKRQLHTI